MKSIAVETIRINGQLYTKAQLEALIQKPAKRARRVA